MQTTDADMQKNLRNRWFHARVKRGLKGRYGVDMRPKGHVWPFGFKKNKKNKKNKKEKKKKKKKNKKKQKKKKKKTNNKNGGKQRLNLERLWHLQEDGLWVGGHPGPIGNKTKGIQGGGDWSYCRR